MTSTSSSLMARSLNAPIPVIVRIEGRTGTLFDGAVMTVGHDVTTSTGGTNRCDGTNANENPFPGPTCTSALDDAARSNGFTFDGTYYPDLEDLFITRIGSVGPETGYFWGLWLNSQFAQVGGSQLQVKKGDHVLWALVPTTDPQLRVVLKLKGRSSAARDTAIPVTVINASTRAPIAGATVKTTGQPEQTRQTNANGQASFTFTTFGLKTLVAELTNGIRSNVLQILVR